ncbi:DUF4947 domain-containing protein [Enterococcus sp. AZ072]|uniref:DUF4947 domain-containing protein n=1 Tax=unclassified Enterococcus TaxID=2608891 RepID=UPI003D26C2A0
MKGLICKYCGGNQFKKTKRGYQCSYCHAEYDFDDAPVTPKKSPVPTKNTRVAKPTIISLFLILFVFSFILFFSGENIPAKQDVENPNDSPKSDYSSSQLSNPERAVRIAELSLNDEEIKLAKASVAEYGGERTNEFEERLAEAQKDHDIAKKKRVKKPPKKDMIIEDPNSEFAVTTYYHEAGFLVAYGPDFEQYSTADILRIWGQPDEIITNSEAIQNNIRLEFDDENRPVNYEAKSLKEQWQTGQLTWREVQAFIAFIKDNSYAGYSKQFVYEKQGKPNVYFKDDRVGYVTPIVRYVSFTRSPEKYPREGLGKYPDDFPEEYGSDGFYHEK